MAKGLGQISQHQVEGLVVLSSQHDNMYNTLNDVDSSGNVSPNLVYREGKLEVNVPIKALNQNVDANGDQSLITRKYLSQKLNEVNSQASLLADSIKTAQNDINVLYSNDTNISVVPGATYDTKVNSEITLGTIQYMEQTGTTPVTVSRDSNGDNIVVEKPMFGLTTKYFKINLQPYAPVANPTLTAPCASATIGTGNNSKRLATTQFVHDLVNNSVVGADRSSFNLNTLKKISTALGDDTNFKNNIAGDVDEKLDFNSVTLSASDTVTTHTKIGSISFGTGNTNSVKTANFYVDLTPYAKHTNATLTNAQTKSTIPATDNDKTVANTKFVRDVSDSLKTALINGATLTTFKALQDSISSVSSAATGGINTKQDQHSLLTALSNLGSIAKDKYIYMNYSETKGYYFTTASITDVGRGLIAKSTAADMRNHLALPSISGDIWQATVQGAVNATQAESATTATKATSASLDSDNNPINTTYQKVSELSTAVSKLAASVATYDSSDNKIVDTYQTKTADRIPVISHTVAAPSSLPQRLYGTIKLNDGNGTNKHTYTIVTGLHNATLTGSPKAPAYSETTIQYSRIATEQDIANMIAEATGVTVTTGGGDGTATGSGGSDTTPAGGKETVPAPSSSGTVSIIRDPADPTKITIVSGNSSIPVTTTGGGNEIVNITLTGGSTLDVTVPGSSNADDVMTKVTLISAAIENDSLFGAHVRSSLDNKQDKTVTLTGLLNNEVIKKSYNTTIPANHYFYATANNKLGTASISSVGRAMIAAPTKDSVLSYLGIKGGSGGSNTTITVEGGGGTTVTLGGDIASVDYAVQAGSAGFATKASVDDAGNVISSYYIPKNDIYVYGNSGKLTSLTSAHPSMSGASDDLAWTASKGGTYKVLSLNDLAFWNGKYDGTNSNLQYFKIGSGTGALGTMASLTATDYFETSNSYDAAKYAVRDGSGNTITSHYAVKNDVVTAVTSDSNKTQILVTKGGATSTITPAHHSYKIAVGNTSVSTQHTAVSKGTNKSIYLNLVDTFNKTSTVISNPVQLSVPSDSHVSIEATAAGVIKLYAAEPVSKSYFLTCTTAATVKAKVCTADNNFKLESGTQVVVKFENGHNITGMTLNVNSTGAKNVKINSTLDPQAGDIKPNSVYTLVYDGTQWNMLGYNAVNAQNSTTIINNIDNSTHTSETIHSSETVYITQPDDPTKIEDTAANVDNETTFFGSCTTAAGTKAKTVVINAAGKSAINSTTNVEGRKVRVSFTKSNTIDNPTLILKGSKNTTALPIYFNGAPIDPPKILVTGRIYEFTCMKIGETTNLCWNLTGIVGSMPNFAVCSTAAATQNKVVTINNMIKPVQGDRITVVFDETNTADKPKLEVNGLTAVEIRYLNLPLSKDMLYANICYDLIYYNSSWNIVNTVIWMSEESTTDTSTDDSIEGGES